MLVNDYWNFHLMPRDKCLYHNILLVGLTQVVDKCFHIQIVVENVFHTKANAGGFVIQFSDNIPPIFGALT